MVKKEVKKTNGKHPLTLPRTFGERSADKLAQIAGSWGFIFGFIAFLILWVLFNTSWILFGGSWDAKPFIMLNLILSCVAALQAPIILMSQNRQSQKDRQRAEYDYALNRKSEREIQEIKKQLTRMENKFFKK